MSLADDNFEDLERQLAELEVPTDVVDITTLDNQQLINRFSEVRKSLYDREEMLNPTTEEGRGLHSERSAILIEMSKRGLR